MWDKLTEQQQYLHIKKDQISEFQHSFVFFLFSGISKQESFYVLCCFKRREFQSLDLILNQLVISEYLYVTLKISAFG